MTDSGAAGSACWPARGDAAPAEVARRQRRAAAAVGAPQAAAARRLVLTLTILLAALRLLAAIGVALRRQRWAAPLEGVAVLAARAPATKAAGLATPGRRRLRCCEHACSLSISVASGDHSRTLPTGAAGDDAELQRAQRVVALPPRPRGVAAAAAVAVASSAPPSRPCSSARLRSSPMTGRCSAVATGERRQRGRRPPPRGSGRGRVAVPHPEQLEHARSRRATKAAVDVAHR